MLVYKEIMNKKTHLGGIRLKATYGILQPTFI